MNKAFLEDLEKETHLVLAPDVSDYTPQNKLQIYIAQKLWSIEQILLQNQEQR